MDPNALFQPDAIAQTLFLPVILSVQKLTQDASIPAQVHVITDLVPPAMLKLYSRVAAEPPREAYLVTWQIPSRVDPEMRSYATNPVKHCEPAEDTSVAGFVVLWLLWL